MRASSIPVISKTSVAPNYRSYRYSSKVPRVSTNSNTCLPVHRSTSGRSSWQHPSIRAQATQVHDVQFYNNPNSSNSLISILISYQHDGLSKIHLPLTALLSQPPQPLPSTTKFQILTPQLRHLGLTHALSLRRHHPPTTHLLHSPEICSHNPRHPKPQLLTQWPTPSTQRHLRI